MKAELERMVLVSERPGGKQQVARIAPPQPGQQPVQRGTKLGPRAQRQPVLAVPRGERSQSFRRSIQAQLKRHAGLRSGLRMSGGYSNRSSSFISGRRRTRTAVARKTALARAGAAVGIARKLA